MTTIRQTNLIESNVGWIGEMPSRWQIVPAKALFCLRSEKAGMSDVHLTPSQKYGVLPQVEYMEITGNRVVLNLTDSGQMKHVEPGDFVSHLRSFQGGLELAKMSGKVSGAYTVLIPREDQYPDYWRYALKSDTYVQALQTTTDQLRDGQSIRMKEFSLIQLPLVPLDEQKEIADFLDRELAQIDALIEKQGELQQLLKIERSTLISTRVFGQNANVAISEMPELPNGWSQMKLKQVANIQASNVDKKIYEDGMAVSLCNYVDVYKNETIHADIDFMQATASAAEIAKFTLHAGQVILTKDSESAEDIGIAAYVPDDLPGVVCGYHLSMLTPHAFMDGQFLKYILDSYPAKSHFARYSNGLTRMALGQGALGALPVPVPPLEIQQELVLEMRSALGAIDTAMGNGNALIAILRERRQSLISAAVTGKIDVRKVA